MVKQNIQITSSKGIFKGDVTLIKKVASKAMERIAKFSDYTNLKVSIKAHGNTTNTKKRKFSLNLLASRGQHVMHVHKEILPGTNDELHHDRHNTKDWNVVKSVQEAFDVLERRILGERERFSH